MEKWLQIQYIRPLGHLAPINKIIRQKVYYFIEFINHQLKKKLNNEIPDFVMNSIN